MLFDITETWIGNCTDEEGLFDLAARLRRRGMAIKNSRVKAERQATEAPWWDEASRWTEGDAVFCGQGIDASKLWMDGRKRKNDEVKYPDGQRAKVYSVQPQKKIVWLVFPKKCKTQWDDQLQAFRIHDLVRQKVSRVAIKDRAEGWRNV